MLNFEFENGKQGLRQLSSLAYIGKSDMDQRAHAMKKETGDYFLGELKTIVL